VETVVENMKSATPSIKWHMCCYHMERKGDHTLKSITHEATTHFSFNSWIDTTPPLRAMDQFHLTILKLGKRYELDSAFTEAEFQRQKSDFVKENTQDEHQEFTETLILPGFQRNNLCEDVKGYKPWCLNSKIFLLFHLLCLGPCYRIWFSSRCGHKSVDIVKVLSCGNQGSTILV